MSFFRSGLLAVLFSLGVLSVVHAAPQKVSAPDGCPTMNHVPLVTIVRGDPALVVAQVACENGEVLKVQLFVRLTDAGKPTPVDMVRQGDGTYQAIIPIALLRGINRFWYYIDAHGKTTPDQAEDGVAQTRWNPVTIVDAVTDGGGAGGGGAGGSKKALYWLLGGAGAAGGAVLLENHNDDGPDNQNPPPPANNPPPSNNSNNEDDEEEEEEDDSTPPVNPPCIPTGDASATSASACDTNSPIGIFVCSSCPNSSLEISASWGPVAIVNNYNGGCEAEPPTAAELPQPPGVPSISEGQFSITVRANGQILGTIPWPDDSYFDCF